MKSLIIAFMFLFVPFIGKAQNKNIKEETTTTTTTIKSANGEKKYVKDENVREVQPIEIQEGKTEEKTVYEMKNTPVDVTSTTTITNPDGTTRTVDIDRSANYTFQGKRYRLDLDVKGYRISTDDQKKLGILRKTSTNTFIFQNKDKVAVAYFDLNGNLIMENYNPKTDDVTVETFSMNKE